MTCNPPSGSSFNAGSTNVICSAALDTEATSGNTGICMFLVIVINIDAPIVSCPENIEEDSFTDQARVTWNDPLVTDNVDTGLSATCTPPSGSLFNAGSSKVTCLAMDSAGNTGSCVFTVIVNNIDAPIVTCQGSIEEDSVTDQARVTWNNPPVTDKGDTCLSATCSPPSGSSFDIGSTDVTCSATNSAGYTGICLFTVTVYDLGSPIVICPGNIEENSATDQATVTWNDPSVTDNVDTGLSATCTPPSGSSFNAGSTDVTCSAMDTAGNTGSCVFTVTINDIDAPIVTCPQSIEDNLASTDQVTVTWNDPTVTDNVDTGLSATCTSPSGSSFNAGSTDITCSATDTAGNTRRCVFTVNINDIGSPIVTCPGTIEEDLVNDRTTVTWNDPSVTDNVDTRISATCTPPSGSSFNIGSTNVVCSARDTAGNRGSCIFTVTVNDVDAPTLTCPRNIEENSSTDQAIVTWNDPSVTDNVDTCLSATCTPPSGSSFNIGSTDVTCSATDSAGYTGSCVFTVTVNDSYAPIVTCSGNIEEYSATDQATVTWTGPSVTDNVDTGLSAACNPPSGSSFNIGSINVTCSAMDTAGNTGSCVFTVTIIDIDTPIVTCPGNIEEYSTTDQVMVTWDDPSVTDNIDSDLSAICTPPSGSPFYISSTDVTCSAMDSAGNTGSCVLTVTINDIGSPVVTCPENIEKDTVTDQSTVTWHNPSVTDNAEIGLSATCNPPSGSSFKTGSTDVTCFVIDSADNKGICTFTVLIVKRTSSLPVYLIGIIILACVILMISTALVIYCRCRRMDSMNMNIVPKNVVIPATSTHINRVYDDSQLPADNATEQDMEHIYDEYKN
ncbi:hyalin-like [Antedon mediterranea]|uniref:hyalin-like n=1 Tax=Antedon mediterranea TaxID=105859 RepID=UPI003AF4D6B2